jgi:hypothetical protein
MSAGLDPRAEILKLARLLETAPERLAYLEKVPADEIRRLRERATEVLFDADRQHFQRVAKVAGLLPVHVVATLGQRVFGPLLCARIAALLDPGRAVDVAAKLPVSFRADVSVELDPRSARDVLVQMPAEQVAEVAHELARREEYVAMGRFVGNLSDDAIVATLDVLEDSELLRVLFVVETKDRLDHVVGLVPEERLASVVRASGDVDPALAELVGLPEED